MHTLGHKQQLCRNTCSTQCVTYIATTVVLNLNAVGAEVVRDGESGLYVVCDAPIRAVTPGQVRNTHTLTHTNTTHTDTQYAVFYRGEECLGGACIAAAGPSLWQQTHQQ